MSDSIFAWQPPASVADNDDADSTINWSEGQNPSTVNNSARAVMARVSEFLSDLLTLKTTGGTGAAYTVTATQTPASLPDGFAIRLLPHATNTGTCTLNVSSLGAKPLRLVSGTNAAAGDIVINKPILATYHLSGDEFLVDAANVSGISGYLQNVVEDTTPSLGGQLDVNGNAIGDGTLELLAFSETASAVNEVTVTNAATGNAPSLSATGDDTNIDLELTAKGSGSVTAGGNTVAVLAAAQTYTASQRGEVTALTSSSASIAIDFADSNNFSHTTTEDTTLANPSNIVAGQHGSIVITQDASTPRTMAFGSYWKNAGGTDDALTATASAVDQINYYVKSSTEIHYNMIKAIS